MEIADGVDDLDSMPLMKRKRLLLSEKEPPLRHLSVKRVTPVVEQKCPGLPRGVKFDPSDEDLLWHLLAETGKGEIEPHPLISEFIATLDDNDSFAYFHPYTLPGVKQDGKVSYYFHKSFKAHDLRSRKRSKSLNEDMHVWCKVGKTKPLYMDDIQRGSKRIMVLYMRMVCGEKLKKTNWVMHQFSANKEDEGGEFVVSKIFYQAKCTPDDKSAVGLHVDIVKSVAGEVGNVVSQKTVGPDFHAGKSSSTSEVPAQSRYYYIQAEESHPHAGWSEADNFRRNPTEASKQGKNQPQFLLDGQQHGNMLAFGELVNGQSVCASEVEIDRPYLSDNSHLGDDDLGKNMEYKTGTTSRSSLDIREDINECVADQVENECQPIDAQPLHDECYVDAGENDVAKCSDSASIESPETVISGGEFGSLNAKSEAHKSVSTLLVPVKAEPMDQIYVTSVSEHNAATVYCSDMSIASLISPIAPSILEANVCLDETSSKLSNFHQKNKKDSGHVISEAKQSCLEQVHVNQNVHDPHTSYHVPILPFEVKAELMEELPCLLIAADYPTEISSDLALCPSEVDPQETQDNHSQDNLLLAGMTSLEHISVNCGVLNQASDPKDIFCNSNDLQCSTTTSGPQDTVNSESSCIIKCCAAKVSVLEDFEASNKLPDSVPSSCPERLKLDCVESRLLSSDQSSQSILHELDVQRTMVKNEFFDDLATDVIDHIPLILRLHASGISNSSLANMESSLQPALPPLGCDSFDSVNVKAKCFSLRRKKKKTATDSVETALEEDVPGLLQVLLDRGITVEEIKLYGDAEDDEAIALDSEDSFKDLETVITKLFSDGPSFLKLSSIRPTKGSKPVYCLDCLISLIEQTRYLRFRQNPVEWGWCRDLQSFIFVFENHNRIVLERPEYGYATYFFELVVTLPIDWQIKRLVTTMKLPFCSRSLLVENKSLLVGEDLTEGQARVLEEYGWIRNSGIGTLLNYCDRVVHDKRSELYSSEWRGKIGKMLMRGYDSGRTILCTLPKKVTEKYIGYKIPEHYVGDQNPEIKLESLVD